MQISYFAENISFPDINSEQISQWIIKIIRQESAKPGDVSIIFCNDTYLLSINQKYLDHDYYTDIVCFDYCENDTVSGDLFISIERIKENAIKYNTQFLDELHRVIIHGIFHLLGFDDKTEDERMKMRSKENGALEQINKIS